MTIKKFPKISACLSLGVLIFLFAFVVFAQKIPAPSDVLSFTPGDDRKLASWNQVVDYFQKLSKVSDRVKFEEIGKSTLGNPFVYATISAPANLKNLEKYKQINAKLADPRLIKSNDKIAQDLIKQGKTIVLITCGIHSTEVGSYLSSMLIADKLANAKDAETLKILDDTIILLVPSLNPDGVDIVKNWYDKTLGTKFEGTSPPDLYHKYFGHDDNRDWYAFTQIETQLTVDKIHNEWHPQIVHDIHQQGAFGSRLFLPPYLPPVEPNVPKEIVEGYTELGNYIAKDLREKGFSGITTDSTYDAWTPARAYSHYHGGVRILSETASCNLASPITVKFDQLRGGLGYDAKKESPNFSPVWKGGEWHLRDITNYMTTAAFSLLKHAANDREEWLKRFYAIGKEAVRPRKKGEPLAYVIQDNGDTSEIQDILQRAEVEFENVLEGKDIDDVHWVLLVKTRQPYISFAKAIFERQQYPDLKDEKGFPIPPYDVTAHNILLLSKPYDTEAKPIYQTFQPPKNVGAGYYDHGACRETKTYTIPIYRSYIPSIDEGWTRFVLTDKNWKDYKNGCKKFEVTELKNEAIRQNNLGYIPSEKNAPPPLKGVPYQIPYGTIIFPDQSPNQILNGFPKGAMPDEYTGGIGADGVANLRKFVEAGGTLVFLNRASDFAIEQFNLPVRDVTKNLPH
ncbi:MAG: M14 family zinc carboxypeptidase, partial [Pyrinomonadaceae bacterium]